MDNLARDCMLARKAGMSCGQWKVMQEPVKPKKEVVPEGWRKCKGCGKVFKPNRGNHIYCDIECRSLTWSRKNKDHYKEYRDKYSEKHKEYMREYRRRKKEEKANGQI